MRELRIAAIAVILFTVVLGLAYPLAMTGVAQVAFPSAADGKTELIGKDYSNDNTLFQSRPSVTDYAPDATFFNNQGPNQKDLADQLKGYVDEYLKRERPFTPGLTAAQIPADAVTTSASGVDPLISEDNARIQANRVAERRGLALERVLDLIDDHISQPLLGLAGPKSVNVVELNAALKEAR
jgi:potassium-transporting ATPase KdpC subunit